MISDPAIDRPRRASKNATEVARVYKIAVPQRTKRNRAFVEVETLPTARAPADQLPKDRRPVGQEEVVVNIHGEYRCP